MCRRLWRGRWNWCGSSLSGPRFAEQAGVRRHEARKIRGSSVIPWGKVSLLGWRRHEHTIHLTFVTETATFIGIDYHKRHSIWHAIDAAGCDLGKGRIEHHSQHDFATLVKRSPNPRVVFEASMNWQWLYEELEQYMPAEHLTLANPFKTRIIAEAQVKTDKIDARILALLLQAGLIYLPGTDRVLKFAYAHKLTIE